VVKNIKKRSETEIFLADPLHRQFIVPMGQDAGRPDQSHKWDFHTDWPGFVEMLHAGNITGRKGEAGFYRESHHLLIRDERLAEGLLLREKKLQEMDSLEEGETIKFLKKAVF